MKDFDAVLTITKAAIAEDRCTSDYPRVYIFKVRHRRQVRVPDGLMDTKFVGWETVDDRRVIVSNNLGHTVLEVLHEGLYDPEFDVLSVEAMLVSKQINVHTR